MKGLAATFILFLLIAGHEPPVSLVVAPAPKDTIVAVVPQAVTIPVPDSIITKIKKEEPNIETGAVNPVVFVEFAKTLIGTPYLYGSIDPKKGFDCSGFITYVFNHFKVKVPRSSVEFTDVGDEVNYLASKPGDLILFTGTDSTIRVVGHMGIVVSNDNNKLYFIHSTSGKQYGVTITELSPYYMSRFVRVARVFPDASNTGAIMASEIKPVKNRMMIIDTARNIRKIKTVKAIKSADTAKSKKTLTTTKTTKTTKKTAKKSGTSAGKSVGHTQSKKSTGVKTTVKKKSTFATKKVVKPSTKKTPTKPATKTSTKKKR